MPDHVHVLAAGQCDASDLRAYVHRCKQQTGYDWKCLRRHHGRLWQEGYHDRILRDADPDQGVRRRRV